MAGGRARSGTAAGSADETGGGAGEAAACALGWGAVALARAGRKAQSSARARPERGDIGAVSRADARDRGLAGDRGVDEPAGRSGPRSRRHPDRGHRRRAARPALERDSQEGQSGRAARCEEPPQAAHPDQEGPLRLRVLRRPVCGQAGLEAAKETLVRSSI